MRSILTERYVYVVFLLGLAVRLIALHNTYVVNQDGTLYISQAQALYYGHKESLFCGYNFLASYPVMIAGVYWILRDWIWAARFVSLFFGFATLIPIFLLVRRYFDIYISMLCTLLFAMLPIFVGSSVDVIRDPSCWFFVALGLFFYSKGSEENRPFLLLLSSLSFILATWARIEASLFIIVSLLFLLFAEQEHKIKKGFLFALPLLVLIAVGFCYVSTMEGSNLANHTRFEEILDKISTPYARYRDLQNNLSLIYHQYRHQPVGYFISQAKTNIWIFPIGIMLTYFLESLLYIFLIPFILGLSQHYTSNIFILFHRFILFILGGLCFIFYIHIYDMWWLDYRNVCLAIIPACIPIGYGFRSILQFISNRFKVNEGVGLVILTLVIILSTLPKNLIARDVDKVVFKEIGQMIASRETTGNRIPLSGPANIYRWLSFYANMPYRGVACPEPNAENSWELITPDNDNFLRHLKEGHIKYLVWTQRQWPADKIDFSRALQRFHPIELGRWHHRDTGEIILYRLE